MPGDEVVRRERPVEQRTPHADPSPDVPHATQARKARCVLLGQVKLREILVHDSSVFGGLRQRPGHPVRVADFRSS